jgi:hypothetical protein
LGSLIDAHYFFSQACLGQLAVLISVWKGIHRSKAISKTQKELLMAIWSAVKSKYESLWIDNPKFMSKVNIVALNEFITDRLSFAYEGQLLDIYQEQPVKDQTGTILNLIPEDFWKKDWKIPKLQDNALVRTAIKEDLKLISHNTRAGSDWFENTKLVGENAE